LPRDHPPQELLDRLFAGNLDEGADHRWAMAHVAGGCRVCLAGLRAARDRSAAGATRSKARGKPPAAARAGVDPDPGELDAPGAYDAAFLTSLDRSAARAAGSRAERLDAMALFSELEAAPPARRVELVTADPRFHTWAVAARLLDAAAEFNWRDTGWEIHGCRLALEIADRLPPERYPAALAGDLRARALAGLAGALAQEGWLTEAETTLDRAWEAQEEGSGDGLERAALLRVAASLHQAAGDTAAAARALRQAASIYRLHDQPHERGRTLQKLALAVGHDNPAQGVRIAEQALELITPGREPRVELAARHLLIWFLNDCGLPWEALDLLDRSRALYRQCRDTEPLALLPWVEARICRRLGRLAAARRGLAAAWRRCRAGQWHQAQTLVSLDLAEVLLAQGKRREALLLLGSCQASLHRWRMHAEGMAAIRMALDAVQGEERGEEAPSGRAAPAHEASAPAAAATPAPAPAPPGPAAVLAEVALYFRRAWRRALPFRGRTG
jgi:hypothetical protein